MTRDAAGAGRSHRRRSAAGLSLVEAVVGISLALSVAAIALPAFVKNLVSSKFVEPVDGLGRIGASACALVDKGSPLPPTAPLTPAEVPRGKRVVDPPGTWELPTWRALAFRPSENGAPHAYAFAFEDTSVSIAAPTAGPLRPGAGMGPLRPSFTATAHGDLDGDGVTSTFAVRSLPGEGGHGLVVDKEMYVEAEVE